jgi:hypothetical protein
MAKKIRRARSFARTATKSMEKKLVENAKKLKENPFVILPDYSDTYSAKYFGKIKKTIEKVNKFNDDIKKLEKISNKRGLDGALAGTLLIAHSEKAPYLAVAKLPAGETTYAQRGKAEKEKLIAVQHFDDPILRLLGIKDIALKRNLHIYSWGNGFFSSGLDANPPDDFLKFVINKTGFSIKNGFVTCGDIDLDIIRNKKFLDKCYLRINWKSANITFALCENCTKTTKNTIFNITRYLIESDISNDFSIDVIGHVVKRIETDALVETQYLDDYLSGNLSDLQFIKKNLSKREETLKHSDKKLLILDGVSYESDINKFIEKLKPNKYEKKGLEYILNNVDESIVLNKVTPNKVLEIYWGEYGLETINSILDDRDMSEKFFSLDDTPSDILEVVFNYKLRQEILSKLPMYKSLPPLASFADHIVRTYKTFGEKKTIVEINKNPDTPKAKSLAYAFLLVMGKSKDKKWKFSQVEIEYGEFLKDYAKKLINSKPEDYHKCLQDLLIASGSSEEIDSFLI